MIYEQFRQFLIDNSNKIRTYRDNIDALIEFGKTKTPVAIVLGIKDDNVSHRLREQFIDWFEEKTDSAYSTWFSFLLYKFNSSVKLCSRCRDIKFKTEFHKKASAADGFDSRCKDCVNYLARERRKKNQGKTSEKECVIYAFKNYVIKNVYIGSTYSNRNNRKLAHLYNLDNNKHVNSKFQDDYSNGANYVYEILEEVAFSHQLAEREDWWKSKYQDEGWYLYSKMNDGGRSKKTKEQWLKDTLKEAEERGYNLKVV